MGNDTRLGMAGVVQERSRILKVVSDVRSQLIRGSASWEVADFIHKRVAGEDDMCSLADKCRFFDIANLGCREGGVRIQRPSCYREKDLGRF
jgi:hypothetical protein